MAWPRFAWLQLSFSPNPVRHPGADHGTIQYVQYSWRPVPSRKSFLFLAFSPTQHTNGTLTIGHVFFLFFSQSVSEQARSSPPSPRAENWWWRRRREGSNIASSGRRKRERQKRQKRQKGSVRPHRQHWSSEYPCKQEWKCCHHSLYRAPNKACPRLRDLATAPARGITQPRTNLIREPCMCN